MAEKKERTDEISCNRRHTLRNNETATMKGNRKVALFFCASVKKTKKVFQIGKNLSGLVCKMKKKISKWQKTCHFDRYAVEKVFITRQKLSCLGAKTFSNLKRTFRFGL